MGERRWIETTLANLIDESAVNSIVANSRKVTVGFQANKERVHLIHNLTRYNGELPEFSHITTHNLRSLSNLVTMSGLVDISKLVDAATGNLTGGFRSSISILNEMPNGLFEVLTIRENRNHS